MRGGVDLFMFSSSHLLRKITLIKNSEESFEEKSNGIVVFYKEVPNYGLPFSGVLSVGVGDAMSSVVGTAVGRTRIFSTHKTLEGTAAGFLSQLGFGYLLSSLCGLEIPEPGFATVCLVTAGFELLVEQVDNLTLPLIMYIGLYIIST